MTIQNHSTRLLQRLCLPLLLAFAGIHAVHAAPASPQVVAGQATFSQQGNVFSITNTPNTIINWQSFSVGAGDIARFIQQDANSAVLNRIVGQDPSRILGALQSNGQVFLINPNGILFGRDARIDVNGLTASTLDMGNADFLAGKRNFNGRASAGSVVHQGAIATPAGGKVFLIAPNVENSGIVTSPQGEVVLAAGHSVQLADSGNPDLHVVVSAPADAALNLGQLIAQGGKIGIYGALVKQRGLVSADSARIGDNGKIVFKASGDALLEAGSVTRAGGAGKGGEISVQGERVALSGDARIDASGAAGGGTVLVGGGWQGRHALVRNAQQTVMGKAASIRADATGSGDGGTVVLWSDGATRAGGSISAQGRGGKGGRVETSGHYLNVEGVKVDTGARGTWLLDPYDITIGATGSDVLADFDHFDDAPLTGPSYLNVAALNAAAPSDSIVIQAKNDVLVSAAIARAAGSTGSLSIEAGNNINVNADLSSGGGNMTLSGANIAFAPGVQANSGVGDMNFNATNVFQLSSGAALKSGGMVTIVANQMGILGSVGPAQPQQNPSVTLRPASVDRDIEIAAGEAVAGALRLAPAQLAAIEAQALIIGGNQFGGKIVVNSALGGSGGALKAKYLLLSGVGNVTLNAPVTIAGGMQVDAAGIVNTSASPVTAGSLSFITKQGVGTAASPLYTQTASLEGNNTVETGNAPIHVSNTGTLTLGNLSQNGGNNSGAIVIANQGGMTLSKDSSVITLGGAVNLSTQSPLDINGSIDSKGGAIALQAGNGGELGIGPQGSVSSGAGNIALVAGSIVNKGSVSATSGNISLSTPSLTGNGTIGSASGTVRGLPDMSTTLPACVNAPARNGCAQVLANALAACAADPSGLYCASLLPSLENCSANPALLGCGVVLPSLGTCVAAPSTAGCGAILPSVATCSANPAAPGCSAVLPSLAACTAAPTTAGCGAVLPTLAACTAAPATAGCSAVLPSLSQCTVNPAQAGCAQVLPSLNTCVAAPSTNGCAAVLPTLGACVATPSRAGCSAVLPTLPACVASPTQAGCNVVLPSLAACSASPGLPGCTVVLPSVAQCTAAPTQAGCAAVLPTLSQCIASTSLPGCGVVLPSLSRCVANPATPGCAVVLPSLGQCVANPGASACAVVLPTLAQCAANAAVPGCNVVLPTLNQCIGNAGLPGCGAVLPSLQSCVANPGALACSVVLPTLAQCSATPSLAACNVVLPSVAQCSAAPGLAGCGAVLPPLAQCVATPSAPGCAVVLPRLSQCVDTPAAAGCGVVLPSLDQCVGSPTLQGCSVVLPPVNACVANPAAPGCTVVAPPQQLSGSTLKEVVVNTVNAVDSVTPAGEKIEKKDDGVKTVATSNVKGDASELRKKTYCN
ncbi:two-partner secretion domain-containing protein [Massilia atriviolacea]|uniref:two-partner secretion domain-containing protein n=1 Tax=Massilia atriviolacea TaxID=2495579 RepID=UPI0018E0BD96|nr:filamentous hemagglutinin N-terminal domain-containing protein [Massilia atriviolacea]